MEEKFKIAALVIGVIGIMAVISYTFMPPEENIREIVAKATHCDIEKWGININKDPYFINFRGRYSNGKLELFPTDICYYLEGKEVTFKYSNEHGYPIAEEIVVGNETFTREPGGGSR